MKWIVCIVIGYALGCISPSWILSKCKKKDLREEGTGNLGGTNVFVSFGKVWGVIVCVLDIVKAAVAVQIAEALYPGVLAAAALTGVAAMMGHMFPFYLHFRGGKGMACLGGVMIGLEWEFFVPLLLLGIFLAWIADYACIMPIGGAVAWPVIYGVYSGSWVCFAILAFAGAVMLLRHWDNIRRICNGTELHFKKQHTLAEPVEVGAEYGRSHV